MNMYDGYIRIPVRTLAKSPGEALQQNETVAKNLSKELTGPTVRRNLYKPTTAGTHNSPANRQGS